MNENRIVGAILIASAAQVIAIVVLIVAIKQAASSPELVIGGVALLGGLAFALARIGWAEFRKSRSVASLESSKEEQGKK